MNYTVKEFELELNSKDFPKLNFQQFEAMVRRPHWTSSAKWSA